MAESRLAGWWRGAATGFCFAVFWLGCAVAAPTALAAICLTSRNREIRARRVRRFASASFRLLLRLIESLGIARFEIEGDEWIGPAAGCLVIANHPTFLDIVVLLSRMPEANCVVKNRLWRHPFLAPFMRAGGYLSNASDPLAFMNACRAARERGEALVVFPEGTRTAPGAPLTFQRGAAQIALRAEMPIAAVTVACTPPLLTKQVRWYQGSRRRVRHVVRFHRPCPPEAFAALTGLAPPTAARRLTRGLQNFFHDELHPA